MRIVRSSGLRPGKTRSATSCPMTTSGTRRLQPADDAVAEAVDAARPLQRIATWEASIVHILSDDHQRDPPLRLLLGEDAALVDVHLPGTEEPSGHARNAYPQHHSAVRPFDLPAALRAEGQDPRRFHPPLEPFGIFECQAGAALPRAPLLLAGIDDD